MLADNTPDAVGVAAENEPLDAVEYEKTLQWKNSNQPVTSQDETSSSSTSSLIAGSRYEAGDGAAACRRSAQPIGGGGAVDDDDISNRSDSVETERHSTPETLSAFSFITSATTPLESKSSNSDDSYLTEDKTSDDEEAKLSSISSVFSFINAQSSENLMEEEKHGDPVEANEGDESEDRGTVEDRSVTADNSSDATQGSQMSAFDFLN